MRARPRRSRSPSTASTRTPAGSTGAIARRAGWRSRLRRRRAREPARLRGGHAGSRRGSTARPGASLTTTPATRRHGGAPRGTRARRPRSTPRRSAAASVRSSRSQNPARAVDARSRAMYAVHQEISGMPPRGGRARDRGRDRRHLPARAGMTTPGVTIDRDRLVETASRMVGTWSYTGHEQAMAELMAELYEDAGLRCQWQQVEDGRANALGVLAGEGDGKSLMLNGHTDTSYSGKEPWLRDVPGFQPEAFVRDGRLYGLGISNMKGALACYVEAARALRDAGVRLRGDLLIAAVCGEIEKTQYGDATGAEYRGYAAGTRYLVSHGGVADMCLLGEPTEGKVVLGHFGALWLRIRVHGDFIHTAFSEGRRGDNSILRMQRGARGRERVDPDLGGRPRERVPRREGDRERRRDRGRLRLAGLAHAASHRRLPRYPRAADEADGRGAPGGARDGARPRRAFPRVRDRGRGLRHRAGRRDRRGPRARRGDRRRARGGLRRGAGSRRDAVVLRCFRANTLQRADGQLRHVDRLDGRRAGREPRDRRARQDGRGLRAASR